MVQGFLGLVSKVPSLVPTENDTQTVFGDRSEKGHVRRICMCNGRAQTDHDVITISGRVGGGGRHEIRQRGDPRHSLALKPSNETRDFRQTAPAPARLRAERGHCAARARKGRLCAERLNAQEQAAGEGGLVSKDTLIGALALS